MGREKNEQVFSGPLYCCVLTEKLERNKENTYRSNFSGVIFSLPRRHFSHWSRLITTNMPMLISLFFLCFFFFNCWNFIFLFISLFSVREASGWAHDLWYFQLTTTNKSKTMWLLLRKTHTHTHVSCTPKRKTDAKTAEYNIQFCVLFLSMIGTKNTAQQTTLQSTIVATLVNSCNAAWSSHIKNWYKNIIFIFAINSYAILWWNWKFGSKEYSELCAVSPKPQHVR